VFRILDFLTRIRITGSVHLITDPALFVFSSVVLLLGCREKEEIKLIEKQIKEGKNKVYLFFRNIVYSDIDVSGPPGLLTILTNE
jgi:hypothetical protein